MTKDAVFTFVAAIIYLAVIYTLVRPGSKGPTIVNNVFNALTDLVRGSIGYTYDSQTGSWNTPT